MTLWNWRKEIGEVTRKRMFDRHRFPTPSWQDSTPSPSPPFPPFEQKQQGSMVGKAIRPDPKERQISWSKYQFVEGEGDYELAERAKPFLATICLEQCCQLDLTAGWSASKWLHAARDALEQIAWGGVYYVDGVQTVNIGDVKFFKCDGSDKIVPRVMGAAKLEDVFSPSPPDACVGNFNWQECTAAQVDLAALCPVDKVRKDVVMLQFWKMKQSNGGVALDNAYLLVKNPNEMGRICIWNYYWACRKAFEAFCSDGQTSNTEANADTLEWAIANDAWLTIPG